VAGIGIAPGTDSVVVYEPLSRRDLATPADDVFAVVATAGDHAEFRSEARRLKIRVRPDASDQAMRLNAVKTGQRSSRAICGFGSSRLRSRRPPAGPSKREAYAQPSRGGLGGHPVLSPFSLTVVARPVPPNETAKQRGASHPCLGILVTRASIALPRQECWVEPVIMGAACVVVP